MCAELVSGAQCAQTVGLLTTRHHPAEAGAFPTPSIHSSVDGSYIGSCLNTGKAMDSEGE